MLMNPSGIEEADMEEEKREKEETQPAKKKKAEDELAYCKTAPSAEHSRGDEEDEPCDDSRGAE